MDNKQSFLLYKSWAKTWQKLPDEIYLDVTHAVFAYQLGESYEFKTEIGAALFEQYKDAFERNAEKYEDICEKRSRSGKKGAAARWGNSKETDTKAEKDSKCHFANDTGMAKMAKYEYEYEYEYDNDNDTLSERESEGEKNKPAQAPGQSVSVKQVVDDYNKTCSDLPKVARITDSRKRAVKSTLKKLTAEKIHDVFVEAQASDFLCGRSGKKWQASFDWLMHGDNAVKVLEGQYKNRASPQQGRKTAFTNFDQRDDDIDALSVSIMKKNMGIETGGKHEPGYSNGPADAGP